MMTDTTEQGNIDPETQRLEVEKRRLDAAISAQKKLVYTLMQEHDRISDLIGKARSALRDAEKEYAKVFGRLAAKKRPA